MEALWFWENKSLGKWWPRTAPDRPSDQSSEGRRLEIRGVIKVSHHHHHLSLNALREIYSRDGRLVGTQGPEHYRAVIGIAA